jgi:hypothetical protein
MPSSEDHLAVIAESYKGIHASTQVMAQATVRMEATQQSLAQTQRGLVRLQGFAVVLIGFCLLFTGYMVWQHVTFSQELLATTQTLAAQTHALIETLQRLPKP